MELVMSGVERQPARSAAARAAVPTTVVVGFGDSFGKSWEALAVTGGLVVVAVGVLMVLFYRHFKDEFGPPGEALRKLLGEAQ